MKTASMKKPCVACPWKVDAHCRDIPRFDLGLSERLVETCEVDGLGKLMQCHDTTDGVPATCAGFMLAQMRRGIPNIMLRLAVTQGWVTLPEDDGITLHETLHEVVAKHRKQVLDD